MYARGGFLGLTRGVTKAHIARAVLESIAYEARTSSLHGKGRGRFLKELRVDGGASKKPLSDAVSGRLAAHRSAPSKVH